MTGGEKKFGRDIALLAKKRGFTPRQVLAIFGVIAAHAVEFEVLEGRTDQGGAVAEALAIFTENMLATLAEKETRQ